MFLPRETREAPILILMKLNSKNFWLRLLSLILLCGSVLWTTSCSKGGAGGKPADVDYYTCTMHPSVKKQNPTDKCPICSMDLVPVKKKSDSAAVAHGEHASHAGHAPEAMPQSDTRTIEDKPGEFSI